MTEHQQRVLRLFDVRDGHLRIGDIDIADLAEQYGTPFYVYDLNLIRERYGLLRSRLPSQVRIFFAVKANPSLSICALFNRLGAGAEVASEGELALALAAGFAPADVILNGPGKTEEFIATGIDRGVGIINIESRHDFRRIRKVAADRNGKVDACIRINPMGETSDARIPTGGGPQKFGIDEEGIGELVTELTRSATIRLCGIHIFAGSQVLDYRQAIAGMEQTLNIAESLAERYNLPLPIVNLGGGLGVPYGANDQDFDIDAFCRDLSSIIAVHTGNNSAKTTSFVLELGRILVADAGVYVATVQDVKLSRGRRFVITDGGINHAMLPITRNSYPACLVNRIGDAHSFPSFVGGPLCTSADLRPAEIPLPEAEPGDLLGIFKSGAYGYSASLLNFLSFPTPAEIVVDKGRAFLVRERGTCMDFLRHQKLWDDPEEEETG